MLKVGTVLDGKYEILKVIGEGGMSVVYLAIDRRLKKQWAIKEVKENTPNYAMTIRNFIIEVNFLRQLEHPALPRIVDIIENKYVVMDYIDGINLFDVVKCYGVQDQESVIDWGIQLCKILMYLHNRKKPIIFRDLKPGNIMLTSNGDIKLIDFGIAREVKEESEQQTSILCTKGFAAPEQLVKEGRIDVRTDIYSLGVTLYYLLTKKNPSLAPYKIYPIREINPQLSTGLEKIIIKCTKSNPNERYNSVEEVLYALENYDKIDSEYILRQKRKLKIFIGTVTLSIFFLISTLVSYMGINNQKLNDYNTMLINANTEVSKSIANDKFSEDAVKYYEEAIAIDSSKKDAYIKLLDYYIRMGQTQNGVDKLNDYIAMGKGKKNSDVTMTLAKIYFNGTTYDSSFNVDYANATKYYAMVDKNKYPEAKYYEKLAMTLSEFSSSIDWEEVSGILQEFEEYTDNINQDINQIDNYISLAKVYIANKNYFTKDTDVYDLAERNLNKALETLEYIDDENKKQDYEMEIYTKLAELMKSRGSKAKNINETDLNNAITYYTLLLNKFDMEDKKVEMMKQIADIYRVQKIYDKAENEYMQIINNYPMNVEGYINYAIMELTECNNINKALELYNRVKDMEGVNKNSNFTALKQKLNNAGLLN